MSHFLTIIWDFQPEIFSNLDIPYLGDIRWYGLLWAFSFMAAHFIMDKVYKIEKKDVNQLDSLFIYGLVGCIVGARLGHCLFYGPHFDEIVNGVVINEGYLSHPINILKIREGGLASHGAAIGLILACFLFYKKYKLPSFTWILDRLAITIAIAGCLIRFGNFTNSEIIGKPSDGPTSIAFVNSAEQILQGNRYYNNSIESIDYTRVSGDTLYRDLKFPAYKMTFTFDESVDTKADKKDVFLQLALYNHDGSLESRHFIIPEVLPTIKGNTVSQKVYLIGRHPSQLYESISCLLLFLIMMYLYFKVYREKLPDGLLIGIFMIGVFTLRFFYEIYKENQVSHENDWVLNTGQLLSFPAVAFGLYFLFMAYKSTKKSV